MVGFEEVFLDFFGDVWVLIGDGKCEVVVVIYEGDVDVVFVWGCGDGVLDEIGGDEIE